MSAVATAIVAGAVVGGVAANRASSRAAGATTNAARTATQETSRQFDTIREDTAQQRAIGAGATGLLARMYGLATPGSEGTFDAAAYLRDNPDVAASDWFRSDPEAHYNQYGRNEGRTAVFTGGTPATAAGRPDMSAFFESPDYQYNLEQVNRGTDRSLLARGRGLSGAAVRESQRNAAGLASGEFNNNFNRLTTLAGLGSAATNTSAQAGLTTAGTNANIITNAGNQRASAYMQGGAGVGSAVQGGLANFMMMQQLNQPNTGGGGYGWNGGMYNGGGMRVT